MIATLACFLIAQSSPTDPPVLLRRDVAHASSHTYWMSYTMRMDMAGVPGAEAMLDKPITVNLTYREDIKPIGNGKAKVKITFLNFDSKNPMLGKAMDLSKQISAMTIDAQNRVQIDQKSKKSAESEFGLMMGGTQTPFGMSAIYPEKPVRYGDSWSMAGSGASPFGEQISKIGITFLGEEDVSGTPCWRTMLAMDMDFGALMGKIAQIGGNQDFKSNGFMTVTGYNLLSKKDGGLVHGYGSGMGTIDVSAQGQNIKMKMKFDLDLRRLN